jgi:CO/xanthine dehydrogenase Mo-binding subunit
MLGIAAAIANAVEDAVGVRILQLPITPERVLAALTARQADVQAVP